jgi:phosphoenolpyruvate carboxykinase (ATP)
MDNGALLQHTAPYFGRAAKNSFYVRDPEATYKGQLIDDLINWGNPEKGEFDNRALPRKTYSKLYDRVIKKLSDENILFVVDAWSGRTAASRMPVRLITNRAPGALFASNIFIEPTQEELQNFAPEWTILHCPDVVAVPDDGIDDSAFIVTELTSGITLIGGTRYHGQIKKAIFSVQNFRLPLAGILTMHAGASEGSDGDSAIHAGLSGTGKTTLSNTGFPVADDQIVVDIHAENPDEVISNMEGGQYAKTENLRRDKEPETFDAIKYGTTAENIFCDDEGIANYSNTTLTANGRVGYPLEYVSTAKASGTSSAPKNITFLTADGFGVLPPVARLTIESGMFHFACGFTSKMPGTEKGIDEPKPTFSAFFGKPFMPLKPSIYMDLLRNLVDAHGTNIWLVNTGWLGPNHANRSRVDISTSKAIINAVRDGKVDMSEDNFWYEPTFKLHIPKTVPGVDPQLLDPRAAWTSEAAFQDQANKLAEIFQGALGKLSDIQSDVAAAAPGPITR